MTHFKKSKLAFFLFLLIIKSSFALGIFFDKQETESLPQEESSSSYLSTLPPSTQNHGLNLETTPEVLALSTSNTNNDIKKLNYSEALKQSVNLEDKVGSTKEKKLCAKGVRWLVNSLFGRQTDAPYTQEAAFACELSATALNSGGLGMSSGKGFRYKEIPANSFHGFLPEGSIITCASVKNPFCSKGSSGGSNSVAGHAEMFLGGRFVSGANDSANAACTGRNSSGQPSFTNIKIFALERVI
jgi:hypothetical protein